MTDWKKVQGSQENQPKEWDLEASPTTVYQKKNIIPVVIDEVPFWEYQERTMTFEEYYSKAYEKVDNNITLEKKFEQMQSSLDDLGLTILSLQGFL